MGRLKMSLVVGAKFGIVVLLMVVLFGCAAREERFEFTRLEMGVKARVVVYAASREKAGSGAQAAFGRIAGLDACMSDYRPDSEVMKLCRGPELERVRVSEDLYRVLKAGARVSEVSGGAFDVTVGPEVALWREARKTGELPAEGVVALVAQRVGWRGVELEDVGPAVRLQTRNMLIDLGGIGKGYAAEEAVKELRRRGMARCLVALAGDICVGEAPSGEKGWRIEVAGSGRALTLRNACVSTSGDSEQFVEIEGKRYSHIVDPRTGWAMTNHAQATVVGRDGAVVDAAGKALVVGGVAGAREVCEKLGVSAVVWEGENAVEVGVIPWE